MNLKQGEVYVCLEPTCKAEIVVRKSADNQCHGNFNLVCCCGNEMVREDRLQAVGLPKAGKKSATA